jgi:CheY-like chemotaxis protein
LRTRPHRKPESGTRPTVRTPRILIADDDPTIRHIVTTVIQRAGFPVVAAPNGRDAYNVLQADNNFAAAIFDMVMPYITGLELVRLMHADNRLQAIPAGIITADADPKLWGDSIAAGAGIFLPKPFTTAQIKYMLRVLLLQSGARDAAKRQAIADEGSITK